MKHLVAHLCGLATLLLLLLGHSAPAAAQTYRQPVRLPVDIYEGDTIPVVHLPNVYIYRPPQFGSRRQERFYWRNVRDVKKTLPIAREVRGIIIETYEYLLTIPDEKARQAHLEAVEKGLIDQYTSRMRKLTFRQGKMLIKLIDRECQQTGFELIKVFMGSLKANFYQTFAALFGASLKKEYDPDIEDAEIEEIIFWIDNGAL